MARPIGKRGWLGVGVIEVTAERAKALKLAQETGVEVTHVERASPAAKAGLKEGDVILEVNGQKMGDPAEFVRAIGESEPGAKIGLSVWRGGLKQSLTAVLEARPAQYLGLNELPRITEMPGMDLSDPSFSFLTGEPPRVGFEGETLTPQLAGFFGVKEGVLVRTVVAGTAAEKAGLKAGDVITKVSGTPVSSPREISGLVRAARRTAVFTVTRNHKEMTLNVELAERRFAAPDREAL